MREKEETPVSWKDKWRGGRRYEREAETHCLKIRASIVKSDGFLGLLGST